VGLCTSSPFGANIDPVNVSGVAEVGAILESMGHDVVHVEPPIDAKLVLDTLIKAWACGLSQAAAGAVEALGRSLGSDILEPNTYLHIEHGQRLTAVDAIDVYDQMNLIARPMGEFFEPIDVLVTPNNPSISMPVGVWDGHRPFADLAEMYRETSAAFEAFNSIWNITGQPAISLPLIHDDATDTPVGMQLIARWGDESTLIRLGAALEAAMPWSDRIAPVDATMAS
jgi:amidase